MSFKENRFIFSQSILVFKEFLYSDGFFFRIKNIFLFNRKKYVQWNIFIQWFSVFYAIVKVIDLNKKRRRPGMGLEELLSRWSEFRVIVINQYHSHRKQRDIYPVIYSWVLMLTWNFCGTPSDFALIFFKMASTDKNVVFDNEFYSVITVIGF